MLRQYATKGMDGRSLISDELNHILEHGRMLPSLNDLEQCCIVVL